jgi:hypothetical protein
MHEARRRHRHLREKQRGAVANRRGPDPRPPAATADPRPYPATATEVARKVAVKALKLLAMVMLSQLGYRLASWMALPVPGSVVAVGMLFSLLSNRIVPARWFAQLSEKAAALLIKHLPMLILSSWPPSAS